MDAKKFSQSKVLKASSRPHKAERPRNCVAFLLYGVYPFHLKGTHLFRFNGPFFDLFKLVLFTPE